ncbi:hypothetical protein DACRYDRAFT_106166 [Dacryopinax primogenitus]|uniref:F-box domain-containing protein n=1 Tax=Dacryopinax primogenitus (strain DJM 731) TaxID=1858805 RepID=M5G452_DACPD|nr:uncharacterized protein DACRYDRAFT_106166 [Dacryopinax primogenitus]EJU02990.1 hypothetical protein DACRYDRAFT_106166 [Dacryopinax primogenitus]
MPERQQPEQRSALLSQAIDICTSLCDVLERLGPSRFTQLDSDIGVSKVHKLESDLHSRLQRVDEKRNDALAPISRLSDDIIRLIIQYGHDDEILDYRKVTVKTFARLVSCISRRWRAISIDMSNVWTDLVFSNPKYLGDEDSKPTHPWYGSAKVLSGMYTSNLERSKQSLLNVQLYIPQLLDPRIMIKEYLHVCTNRVADLNLEANTSSAESMNAIVPCVTQTRETLRRLRIVLEQSTADDGGRDLIETLLLCNLPRLVDVHLQTIPLPLVHRPEFVGFLQCRRLRLEMFHLRQYTPARLVGLLKCVPRLQQLHLVVFPHESDQVAAEPNIHGPRLLLPELRTLKFISSPVGRHTLGQLLFPKIESLSAFILSPSVSHHQETAYVGELRKFLTASSSPDGMPPPVKALSVDGGILRSLHRILRVIPGLEVLQIVFDHDWSPVEEEQRVAFLNKLGAQPLSPKGNITSVDGEPYSVLCPNLQALESLAWAKPSHIQSLTTLASRRRSFGMPLTRIRMLNWPLSAAPPETVGMPATPSEEYALEKALAREVEILECGEFRWEWKEGGRWFKAPRVGDPRFLSDAN